MNAVQVAINMETDAIKFYTECADKVIHPFGKKMFLSFVEDEKRHLEMLKEIFEGVDITIKTSEPMYNIKSIFVTLKDQMMTRVAATTDERNALKIAMSMEKEGYHYYQKAAQAAKKLKERKLFERLVYEEDNHYKILENTYSFITDSGNWYMWDEYSIVEG